MKLEIIGSRIIILTTVLVLCVLAITQSLLFCIIWVLFGFLSLLVFFFLNETATLEDPYKYGPMNIFAGFKKVNGHDIAYSYQVGRH